MCFSAEASFGAAAVITTVGVIAYKKAPTVPLRFLATIPFFFGIQQFCEGIVWLSLVNEGMKSLVEISSSAFIFFAWIIWPLYIPFTMWKLETHVFRRMVLFVFMLAGAVVVSTLAYIMIIHGVKAEILDCSINYTVGLKSNYAWLLGVLYVGVTTVPMMISSFPKVWILSVLNLITYAFTKLYYQDHVISVWCFLAAISSLTILWIIMSSKKEKRNQLNKQ